LETYADLFAQVTTVKVLIAEPTTPARTDPSIAWFITMSGNMLPSHDVTFGTTMYPTDPMVKPRIQKIKIARPLDTFVASRAYRDLNHAQTTQDY
jgi:hypothetical protein